MIEIRLGQVWAYTGDWHREAREPGWSLTDTNWNEADHVLPQQTITILLVLPNAGEQKHQKKGAVLYILNPKGVICSENIIYNFWADNWTLVSGS